MALGTATGFMAWAAWSQVMWTHLQWGHKIDFLHNNQHTNSGSSWIWSRW